MFSTKQKLLLATCILLALGRDAHAGTYADPTGFSFTFPDGWVPVNQAAMADVKQAMPAEVRNWLAKNNMDLNRVAVLLVRVGPEEFLESLNVVVNQQQIPINDKSVKELTSALPQQYGAMGVKVDNLQGRSQKVGSRDAIVVDYQAQMPGVPHLLRQRQIMIPGDGKTYIVTCTAKADSFDRYQQTFDTILASFQAPAAVSKGFDLGQIGTKALIGAIIGGVVGGLIGLFKLFSKKSKP